jgi:NhaP-type Na+/H+ or K+/H+ antiporter
VNRTISSNLYLDTLLGQSTSSDTLLFSSILAATDPQAIEKILSLGKIEVLLRNLKDGWSD